MFSSSFIISLTKFLFNLDGDISFLGILLYSLLALSNTGGLSLGSDIDFFI